MTPLESVIVVYMVNAFENGTELSEVITAAAADDATAADDVTAANAAGCVCEAHVLQFHSDADEVHCCAADVCQASVDAVAVACDKNGILLSAFCCGRAYAVDARARVTARTFWLDGAIAVLFLWYVECG